MVVGTCTCGRTDVYDRTTVVSRCRLACGCTCAHVAFILTPMTIADSITDFVEKNRSVKTESVYSTTSQSWFGIIKVVKHFVNTGLIVTIHFSNLQ